ncbi:outer arm dynein light chain 1 protein [Anaeramoeba flamelloides]|uniref:Outer arm dynein light chain 1 protein n=1 Tax=Anaeramoeba flamelloides TaxID=1746091 RepID=A0ABQ8X4P7_9EUKA|nr:outer arm dynein light chain 1 protein [Anaeramoeba flamelloides]
MNYLRLGENFRSGRKALSLKLASISILTKIYPQVKRIPIIKKNQEAFGFTTEKTFDQQIADLFLCLSQIIYLRIDFPDSPRQKQGLKKTSSGMLRNSNSLTTEGKIESQNNQKDGNDNYNLSTIFQKLRIFEIHGGTMKEILDLKSSILPSLHTFIIQNNQIHSFREVFHRIDSQGGSEKPKSKLHVFTCSCNSITEIDKSFHSLTDLRKIDLNNNQISKIENLKNNFKLISLNLRNNKISSLHNINRELGNITELVLSENQIKNIGDLHNLKALEILDLSGNMITKFQEIEKLQNLRILKRLFLKSNPICKAKNYFEITVSFFNDNYPFFLDNIEITKYINNNNNNNNIKNQEYNLSEIDFQNEKLMTEIIKLNKSSRSRIRIAKIEDISQANKSKKVEKKKSGGYEGELHKQKNEKEQLQKEQLNEITDQVNILKNKVDELKKEYEIDWLNFFNKIDLSQYLTLSEKKEEQLKQEKKTKKTIEKN